MVSRRELIYYEAWRKDPATGIVVNASMTLPEMEHHVERKSGWVRSNIHFHYKRFTPVDDGKSTYYETIQQVSRCVIQCL